jgi:hypothetical protein
MFKSWSTGPTSQLLWKPPDQVHDILWLESFILNASLTGALPSLAICTNAARSCARIFHAQDKRGVEPNQNMLVSVVGSVELGLS